MCEHKRVFKLTAETTQWSFVEVPHVQFTRSGLLPYVDHICGGDEVKIVICLDCCAVVGMQPLSDDDLCTVLIDEDN